MVAKPMDEQQVEYLYGYDREMQKAWRMPCNGKSEEYATVFVSDGSDFSLAKWGDKVVQITDLTVAELWAPQQCARQASVKRPASHMDPDRAPSKPRLNGWVIRSSSDKRGKLWAVKDASGAQQAQIPQAWATSTSEQVQAVLDELPQDATKQDLQVALRRFRPEAPTAAPEPKQPDKRAKKMQSDCRASSSTARPESKPEPQQKPAPKPEPKPEEAPVPSPRTASATADEMAIGDPWEVSSGEDFGF